MRSFITRVSVCLIAFFVVGFIVGSIMSHHFSQGGATSWSWQTVSVGLLIMSLVSWVVVYFFCEWLLAPLFYWFRRVSTLPIDKVVGSPSDVKKTTEWYFLRDHFTYMKRTIDSQHRELQQKTLESQEAHQLKIDFIKNMSHHLRTPLNSMIGASRLLYEGESTQELQKIAFCNAQDISGLVESLMTLAEIDSAMLRYSPQWTNFKELIDQALTEVVQTTGLSHQELPLHLSPNLPQRTFYDPDLLVRMVKVLTRTCLRSFPKGVQMIQAWSDENSFAFTLKTEEFEQDNLDRLLDRFPKISSQYVQQYPLLSVNLSLVKELAEFCGGNLLASSIDHKGLCLELRLPLNHTTADSQQEKQWDLFEESEEDLKQVEIEPKQLEPHHKILIAEDNRENQFVFAQYLTHRPDQSYEVIFASDGVQALQKVRSEKPDLVMLDMMMPNMGGIETAKKIRADAKFKDIPLIAVTSMASGEDREQIEGYVDAYLSKPVMVEDLYKTLDCYLKAN